MENVTSISDSLSVLFGMDCKRMTLKERWKTYHKLIEAHYGPDHRLYDATFIVLSGIIHNETLKIKNLDEDEQNEDLEELYKTITLCMGQDFEVIDRELQSEPIDPDPENGSHYQIVNSSFNTIALMAELCEKIKRFDTERMCLKMVMNFIRRSFDKNGHFNLIDLILSESEYIVHLYICCLKKLNQVEIALQDITAIITTFEILGVKKPRNYGYLLWAKAEALEAINMFDEAIVEYKKSIKCSKRYYLYHINSFNDYSEVQSLLQVYEEPTKHLHELYTSLGRHQDAVEVLEKFLDTIAPIYVNETKVMNLEPMKFNLAKSYTKVRRCSEAKQCLLSITHVIRDETKKSLAKKPLCQFTGNYSLGIDVFTILELYLQCIELKPSSKKKSLPKIAQHLLDHMKNDDFVAQNPQIMETEGSFEKWIDTIVGVTLDCLKDNIQYADLNEIYALKLKHMVMRDEHASKDKNYYDYYDNANYTNAIHEGIEFGLKVLKRLKENNGLDYVPQVIQQICDLYLQVGYVHEALDLKMESADYSSIDSKWHMDMANCYLDIDQHEEAWSHIMDAHHCDDVDLNTTVLFYIKTGQYDLAWNSLVKKQWPLPWLKSRPLLIELLTLVQFKLTKIQKCVRQCALTESNKEGSEKEIDLTTFLQLCTANLLDKNCEIGINIMDVQKIHNKYYKNNSSMKRLLEDVWKHVLNHKAVRSGGFEGFVKEIFNVLNCWKEKFNVNQNELILYENSYKISNQIRMKKIYHEI